MQAMSKFYDGGVAQVFDTVIVEGNWRPTNEYCKPVIKSFSPDSVAGGIGQILTIKGQCFGPFADNFSWVFFTDASKGIDTIRYTEPIIGEYKINCGASSIYCWSDTMIQVKVHSVSKVNGVSSIAKYAGSGKIQVWNFDGEFGESTTPLYVNYSALNTWTTSTETPSKSAIPVSLQDANDHEGMTLTIGANLDADTDAKNAFIRALNTWKCATKVNFNLDPTFPNSDSVCLVDYGALATSVLGSVKNGFQTRCKYNTGGEFIKAYRKKFDLIFSNSVPFFKLEDLSAFGILEYDLQTVALHELGHSHLLNHVNQEIDVMYAKLDKGISKRDLSNGDIAGGSHIMTISGYTYAGSDCNAKPMLPADVSGLGCSTDIKETENEQQCFKMFPNPAYAQVTIHLCDYTDVAIVIYNAFGKQVLYQNYNNINSVVTVNVESLPSGTYFVKIKSATNSAITTKMIKI